MPVDANPNNCNPSARPPRIQSWNSLTTQVVLRGAEDGCKEEEQTLVAA
jgi:hypothetical protein